MSRLGLKEAGIETNSQGLGDNPQETIFPEISNGFVVGEAVRRVIETIDGGMSPATEAMLEEMTESWNIAQKRELELIEGGYPFSTEGLHTPESLDYLRALADVTSRGSRVWVVQPGLVVDTIRAGLIRLQSGRLMTNWLSMASSSNLGGTHPDIEIADIWTSREIGSANVAAYTPWKGELIAKEALLRRTPGDHDKVVVFASDGGGACNIAIEAAMLAGERLFRRSHGAVIACEEAYHGNQGLAGEATGHGVSGKYEHHSSGMIYHLPFPHDPESAEKFLYGFPDGDGRHKPGYLELVREDKVNGVILEEIQGDGGYLELDREVAEIIIRTNERVGALTIFDEVQGGMGRSGSLWMFEALGPELAESPNIAIVTGKALSNGSPVSAVVLPKSLDAFRPPEALSTMMAIPSGLVRMMTMLEIVDNENFLLAVRQKGELLKMVLENGQGKHLRGYRGRGLMCGAEVTCPDGTSGVTPMVIYLACRGILTSGVSQNGLRLHPYLTVDHREAEAVGRVIVEGGRAMDNGTIPKVVYEMASQGKSGLDR
jgi:4-aminobutyrate aminotransferase-like enzyme